MPQWNHTLDLSDVFHNDAYSFEEKRDTIVSRIQKARFYDPDDFDLKFVVLNLRDSQDVEEFDGWWDDFYYWADYARVWVRTQ